jgi:hypothetical protein
LQLFFDGSFVPIKWEDDECSILSNCDKIVYGIHGYMESLNSSSYLSDMVELLSQDGSCSVAVDWGKGSGVSTAGLSYFQAVANLRAVGAAVGYHASRCALKNPNVKVKVVGMSLGGQTIGEVARYFEKAVGRKLDVCHGLDPAGPLYDGCSNNIRLHENSCKEVQVLHSNGMRNSLFPVVTGLGTGYKSGKCDFWVNCGHIQPICIANAIDLVKYFLNSKDSNTKNYIDKIVCSHIRGAKVYVSQLRNNCFFGQQCDNCALTCEIARAVGKFSNVTDTTPLLVGDECAYEADYFVETTYDGTFCPKK